MPYHNVSGFGQIWQDRYNILCPIRAHVGAQMTDTGSLW